MSSSIMCMVDVYAHVNLWQYKSKVVAVVASASIVWCNSGLLPTWGNKKISVYTSLSPDIRFAMTYLCYR